MDCVETFRGYDPEYLEVLHNALICNGVDLNSDSAKAFYDGYKFGMDNIYEYLRQQEILDIERRFVNAYHLNYDFTSQCFNNPACPNDNHI